MKFIQICYLLLVICPIPLLSQTSLIQFNELPTSSVINGPESDIVHKYHIYFDDSMDLLLIREEKRNQYTGELDFVQLMYEIPIDHLSKSSFVVDNDRDLNELRLKINLPNNVPQIYNYWISEGEIVSILCLSKLGIGPWEYSEELEEKLKIVAKGLGTQFGQVTTKDENPYEFGKAVYKYGNKRATMIGKKELDGKLNKDYYFPYSITSPPQYKKHKSLKIAEQAMIKSLRNQLGLKNGAMSGIPVFVYLDKNGKLESIFITAKEADKLKESVNLDEFRSGGKNNGEEVKCKFVMLL